MDAVEYKKALKDISLAEFAIRRRAAKVHEDVNQSYGNEDALKNGIEHVWTPVTFTQIG